MLIESDRTFFVCVCIMSVIRWVVTVSASVQHNEIRRQTFRLGPRRQGRKPGQVGHCHTLPNVMSLYPTVVHYDTVNVCLH